VIANSEYMRNPRADPVLEQYSAVHRKPSRHTASPKLDRNRRWLWWIRQQLASKPGHCHNQGHRSIWHYFSHHNRQRHSAVAGRNDHDRIISWIGGQALYWLFLRRQTHARGTLYWEAFQLRLGGKPVEEE